jgi:hypothetical protein
MGVKGAPEQGKGYLLFLRDVSSGVEYTICNRVTKIIILNELRFRFMTTVKEI